MTFSAQQRGILDDKYCHLTVLLEHIALIFSKFDFSTSFQKVQSNLFITLLKSESHFSAAALRQLQDIFSEILLIIYGENNKNLKLNNEQLNYILNLLTDFIYDYILTVGESQQLERGHATLNCKKMICLQLFWQVLDNSIFWQHGEHKYLNVRSYQLDSIKKSLKSQLQELRQGLKTFPFMQEYLPLLESLEQKEKPQPNRVVLPQAESMKPLQQPKAAEKKALFIHKSEEKVKYQPPVKPQKSIYRKNFFDSFLEFFG